MVLMANLINRTVVIRDISGAFNNKDDAFTMLKPYGNIVSEKYNIDKNYLSVTFDESSSAERAVNDLNGKYNISYSNKKSNMKYSDLLRSAMACERTQEEIEKSHIKKINQSTGGGHFTKIEKI